MVKPGATHDWNRLTCTLGSLFRPHAMVEFLPGSTSFLKDSENDEDEEDAYETDTPPCSESETEPDSPSKRGKVLNVKPYPQESAMGASIGEVGRRSAGTLGGFACLTIGDKVHRGWVTNHHIIRSDRLNAEESLLEAQFGYGSRECRSITPPTMQYPAPVDLDYTRHNQLVNRNSLKHELKQIARYAMRPLPQSQVESMEDLTQLLEEQVGVKSLINQLPLPVGDVLFSSGDLQTDNKMILDWAFIELPDTSSCPPLTNRLPDAAHPRFENHQPSDYGCTGRPYLNPSNATSPRRSGKIEKDEWYFKKGRTTGITTGICNGVALDIPYGQRPQYLSNGQKAPASSRSLIVLGQRNDDVDEISASAFSQPGDSGSWVIDRRGRVCGWLYGALTSTLKSSQIEGNSEPVEEREIWMNDAGLVTSFDDVLASIKAKTGGDLSLP